MPRTPIDGTFCFEIWKLVTYVSPLTDTLLQAACVTACFLHTGELISSQQDFSVSCLTVGLHPHCQIPQFRMLLPSMLGSILTAKYLSSGCFCPLSGLHPHCQYLSSGCFCPPSGLHPHCQIPQFRMLLPSIWAQFSLPNTSVHDASSRRMKSNHCLYIAKDTECIVKFLFRSDDVFLYPLKRLILNCCYILFKVYVI